MKRFFLFIVLSTIVSFAFGLTKKTVYITLDVSGSMHNDKYVLANYAAQLISTLCDQDDVYLIIYGHSEKISGNKDLYKKIQIKYEELNKVWKVRSLDSQIEDIREFNRIYKDEKDKEQWLFIVGDGIWETRRFDDITEKFKKIVDAGKLHVQFIQTGTLKIEHNDFTSFLETLKIVNILKSSTSPESIIASCNNVTCNILGLSLESLKTKQEGKSCVSVTSELPSKRYIVLYQDEIEESALPKLKSITQNNKPLAFLHKGTPSTSSILGPFASKLVSGNVWIVNPGSVIQKGIPVKFCFNKTIDPNKLKVFPVVYVKQSIGGIKAITGDATIIDETTIKICKDNKKAVVTVNLKDEFGKPLPLSIIKNTKVEILSNNSVYKAEYKSGIFECELPLVGETTLYYSRSECPGYFTNTSRINRIIRKENCKQEPPPPPPPADTTLPVQVIGSISFKQLLKGKCIDAIITDLQSKEILDPSKFNISVTHNYPLLFRKAEIIINGNQVTLCFEARGDWCDCFTPDTLELTAKVTPKKKADFGSKIYNEIRVPLKISIIKDSWFSRCKLVIFSMAASLLLFIYFYYLSKKARFKKGSVIVSEYSDYYNKFAPYKDTLRKRGFTHWLNRWLNPFGNENRSITFMQVRKSINFIATKSRFRIKFLYSSFDSKTMSYVDYDEESKDPYIMFGAGNTLTIKKTDSDEGKMKVEYDPKENINDDVPFFKTVLAFIMFGLIMYFLAAGYLLIRSIPI